MADKLNNQIRETVEKIGKLELCFLNFQSEVLSRRKTLLEVVSACQEHGRDFYQHLNPEQADVVRLAVSFAVSWASLTNSRHTRETSQCVGPGFVSRRGWAGPHFQKLSKSKVFFYLELRVLPNFPKPGQRCRGKVL